MFVIRHTDGIYYFTASVPAYDRIVLRSAERLEELADAEEVTIWMKHESWELMGNSYLGTGAPLSVWTLVYLFCGRRGGGHVGDPSVCAGVQRGRTRMTDAGVERGMMQRAPAEEPRSLPLRHLRWMRPSLKYQVEIIMSGQKRLESAK